MSACQNRWVGTHSSGFSAEATVTGDVITISWVSLELRRILTEVSDIHFLLHLLTDLFKSEPIPICNHFQRKVASLDHFVKLMDDTSETAKCRGQ